MIRPTVPDDTPALLALALAGDLFRPTEIDYLRDMPTDYFGGNPDSGRFWIIDQYENGDPVGLAFYEPAAFTTGTCNLQLIAIHRDYQGRGRGAELIRHIEKKLTERGERLFLVETSGLPSFERTRRFYLKYGFTEEAHIRDFYNAGEDKIVFRKELQNT
ncbi:MAG: GNAT family N-acetyltransferase [Akkermansiaceae bacterium]|nr:GNAT family N-acetyltransferase [Armatimonadota bacterium]